MSIADPRAHISTFQHWLRPWPRRYAFSLLAVLAATIIRYALGLVLGLLPPFALFFSTIILVTLFAGFGPGVFATLLSVASVAFFFWAPLNVFGTSRVRDIVGLGLFSLIGVFFSGLADLYRRRETRLHEFEEVVQGLEDMIVVVDRNYRYVIANEAFLKYRGMKAEEVLGHRVDEVIYPDVFESTVKDKMDECFQGKVVRYEMQYQYVCAGTRDLCISYIPIRGRDGIDRLACILRDVTEKKRAAAALRESEDRCRDLVEHSEDLICTHDLSGNLLSVNPAPARVLGYSTSELLTIPMRELMAPEFRDQFDAYLSRIKTNGTDRGTLCVLTKTGERRVWEYSNTLRTEGVASPIVRGMAHDITERYRSEVALRKAKEFSENLIQTANVIILGLDTDGNVNLFNHAGEEITGYTFAELKGKSWLTLVPRDRSPHVWAEFDRLIAGTAASSFRNTILTKKGEERYIAWRNSAVKVNGKVVATISFGNDITECTHAEEALRRREEDYRSFVAQSSEGIFREDMDAPVSIGLPEDGLIEHILHDSYLAECNDALARMYGHDSAQGLLGSRLSEMLLVDDPHNIELTREYIRSGFRILERESHEVDIHGNPKVFRNSMIGIVEDGKLVRTWGIQRDVTEQVKLDDARKQAEAALRKSEEHFRILVEQASDGIFMASPDGRYLDVNTAGAKMLGYTREEILQLSIADIIAEDEIPRVAPEVARFAGGAIILSEWKFRRKDGSFFPGEVCGKRLPDGCLQGILRDITERKRAEDALRHSEERFRVALKDSPITVFNQDRDLRYTWIYNPHLYWQTDIIGKTDEEIIGEKRAARLTEMKHRVLNTGEALREEVNISHNGTPYAFDMTIEPLFDSQHQVIGITGASMDVARLWQLADGLQHDKDQLVREKSYLEKEIETELGFEEIVGQSPALREVLNKARVVAPTDSTVLLLGETGTGKELVARSVHGLSLRNERNFIKLNCAAVPSGLLESELFGHEKGAFTGAVNQKVGRIELADKGTLFLDEIGELPFELQPKLLRVLQDLEFERLGGVRTLHVDVRIIAATNRDLWQEIANKAFREDLFYRLNVFPILLPALRERRSDIPMLIRHFVDKYATRMGKRIDVIPDETLHVLQNWNWPGNVRELENMIERMVILTKSNVLAPAPAELETPQELEGDSLKEMERDHILHVLRETHGVLSGADGAASRLGMKRTTLQSKMKRLGIGPHHYRNGASRRYNA